MKEEILLGGMSGVGKSTCCLQIAEAYPKSKMYYIDTDGSAEKIWKLEFPHVKNITYKVALNYTEMRDTIKNGVRGANLTPSDWVVCEMVDNIWTFTREFFTKGIFGEDLADYMMLKRIQMRDAGKKGGSGSMYTPSDWDVMNTLYLELIFILWYQIKAHFIATTSIHEPIPSTVFRPGPKEVQFYGSLETDYGFRYDGHKENLFRFDSHLLLAHDRSGRYLTTIKERASRVRRTLDRIKLSNFVIQYLCPVAGFQLPEA